MRKIIIEHSGTEHYNEIAQKIKTLLEFEHECDTECMIGDSAEDLKLHWQPEGSNEFVYLASMKSVPSKEALRLYINFGTD